MSWAPQVVADRSGQWTGNGLRFATEEEAKAYAEDLMMRWTAVTDIRAVESPDPVNYRWVNFKLEPVTNIGGPA